MSDLGGDKVDEFVAQCNLHNLLRILMIAIVAGAIGLSISSSDQAKLAYACTCAERRSVEEEAGDSAAVFSGQVTQISAIMGGYVVRVEFTVEQIWKGPSAEVITIDTASSGDSCGYGFQNGERYLVYAHRDEADVLGTSICSRTSLLSDAQDDLKVLAELYQEVPSSVYFGAVNPRITNSEGNEIKLAKPDHEVIFKTLVANLADEYKGKRAATITEIRDENGVTLYLSWQSTNSTSEGRINLDFSWTPESNGLYFVRQFVVTDLEMPEILTLVESTTLIVLEKEDYQDNRETTYLANFSLPEIEILRNYTLKQAEELQQKVCGRAQGYLDLSQYLDDNNANDTSLIVPHEEALPQKVKFAYFDPGNPIYRQACALHVPGVFYSHFFFVNGTPHSFPYEGLYSIHTARAAAEYVSYVKYSSGGTGYNAVLSESEYDELSSGCGAYELSPVKGIRITAYGNTFYSVEINVVDNNSGRFLYTEWIVPSNNAEESQLVTETTLGTGCGVI